MSSAQADSDKDWGDIGQVAEPKRVVPRWFLFCGGGCLLLTIALLVAGYYIYEFAKKVADQDAQYPLLAEEIGYDHRLDDYHLVGWDAFGSQGFMFTPITGGTTMAIFMIGDSDKERNELKALLDPQVMTEMGGVGERSETALATLNLQGRELTVLRALQREGSLPFQEKEEVSISIVDLSRPESTDLLLLMLMHLEDSETISDQEIEDFLKPFHVGPQREPSVPTNEGEEETDTPQPVEEGK